MSMKITHILHKCWICVYYRIQQWYEDEQQQQQNHSDRQTNPIQISEENKIIFLMDNYEMFVIWIELAAVLIRFVFCWKYSVGGCSIFACSPF